jgi:Fe-S cluster biogenesis protein NfuA
MRSVHAAQCRKRPGGYDPPVARARPIDPRRLSEVRLLVGEVIEELRPGIQEDDGDVELVDVTPEGVVQVRFKGACVRCPSSSMTLHGGIERAVREAVPEVGSVVSVS